MSAPAANSPVADPSTRSIPFGSGPSATMPTGRGAALPARSTATRNSPSSSRGGARARAVSGGPTTVTGPWARSARASSASPPWPIPSSSQSVSKASVRAAIQSAQAARSGAQAAGESPASRSRHSAPVRHGISSPARGRAAMVTTAACRPVRAASSRAAAARSIRRLQSGASPQPPSTRTRSGSSVPAGRGFRTGPAKARIAAASASMRRRSSHHGVRSGIFSGSRRPEEQPHAGEGPPPRRRRHRAQQPPEHRQRDEPEEEPRGKEGDGPDHPLTPAHPPPCRARAAPAAAARWYGGSTSASRGAGRRR